jgi:hypothetical protein
MNFITTAEFEQMQWMHFKLSVNYFNLKQKWASIDKDNLNRVGKIIFFVFLQRNFYFTQEGLVAIFS